MSIFSKPRSISLEYYGNLIPQLVAFFIYCSVFTMSYYYCCDQLEERKNEILKDYYNIILNHSLVKFDYLLQKLPVDSKGLNTNIGVDGTNIQSCYQEQCVRSNLFEFASAMDKHIPYFIYYKIEINKQSLHHNAKMSGYEFEKNFYINDYNQLFITLSIDSKYWNKIKNKIIQPYLFTIIVATAFLILFILSNKLLYKYIKKYYFLYYKNNYDLEIEKITIEYQNELKNKENILMKKIWNLEYSYTKEAELNYLFSQEANNIAVNIQEIEYISFNYQNKFSPYTIPLYRNNQEPENINIKNLIENFTGRFSKSEDNISFIITSSEPNIEFVSKAALYQIIYSIISYIIFILKEQSYTSQYNIKLNINNKQERICLLFEYDGFQLNNEEDVFRFSNKFFKKNGSPFLLSLNQIFAILKSDKFSCKLGHNKGNFIEITKNTCIKSLNKTKSNVIKLPIRNE